MTPVGEVMGAAIKAAWLEGENYLKGKYIYWESTGRGNACQPGGYEPGNQACETEASLRSAQLAFWSTAGYLETSRDTIENCKNKEV